jgi:Uncharacterized protein conserved in bacteria (DUF2188)
MKNIWISPIKNNWVIRRAKSNRPFRVVNSKIDAIKIGRKLAKNNKVILLIQNKNGQISQVNNYRQKEKNNTVYSKKSDLDQFYTAPEIAKQCYVKIFEHFPEDNFDLFLEPSAGNGAFFALFPKSKRIGIDLEPKYADVEKMNFFDFIPPNQNKKIIAIGNPPFGKNASMAIKFFNKAAEISEVEVIAFIVPKTFQKQSLQNKLHLNFILKYNLDLPKNSFIFDGLPYNVPCCFQIWARSKNQRKIEKIELDNEYFEFVAKKDADIAVRRVGGRTGKARKDVADAAEVSHYFLKIKNDKISINDVIEKINNIDFGSIINLTAGVKSLSKPELVSYFLKNID